MRTISEETMARAFQKISVVLLALHTLPRTASARNNGLSLISDCICQGYNATFECSVMGPGSTVWRGSSFRDCSNNRITLFHSQFPGGIVGTCNFGAIVGRSVGVENSCYTSQLNVFVSTDTIETTIFCFYDDGVNEFDRGNSTIILTTVPLQPPSNVTLSNVTSRRLTFAWNPVISSCPATKYNITTTSCGTCPSSTRSTSVTCLNPQPQPNAGVTCTFSVRTETCEGVISGQSESVTANLKVPDIPEVKIVPTYSQSERILISLHVTVMELRPFYISDGIDGSTTVYTVNYFNLTSGEMCGSAVIPVSSCMDGVCIDVFNVTSSLCFPSTELSITIFASNILGHGEVSEAYTYKDVNTFVDVGYNMMTKRFTCTFINKQDNSEKSCTITLYRDCQQQLPITAQANSTDSEITLVPDGLQTEASIYCYVVVARNDTITLNVNGTIGQTARSPTANAGAIAGGVSGAIVLVAILASLIIIIGLLIFRGKIPYFPRANGDSLTDGTSEGLTLIKDDRFMKFKVEKPNCELKPFIQDHNYTFYSGAAFYEFTRAEEDIRFDKEVILMDKKNEKLLYTGRAACDMIGAPGEAIKKPKLPKYRVFIQSKGIGSRPLGLNSLVLYERNPVPSDTDQGFEHIPVDSDRFQKLEVTMDCELREFIESHHKLTYKPGCAFSEFKSDKQDINERKEVLLMDKNTGEIFTGPGVLKTIGAPGKDIERPSLDRWRVFVQSMYGAGLIHEGTILLYENLGSDTDDLEAVDSERLEILDVDKICTLRDFVEKKHQLVPYNPRRFFFEFVSAKEEITDDKEIILLEKDTKRMFTGLKAKEMIGAPAKEVRTPSLYKYRVFVQNGGGGGRCLRAGTSLLYEKSYKF